MRPGAYFKTPYLIIAFLTGVALRSFFNVPNYWVFGGIGVLISLAVFLIIGERFSERVRASEPPERGLSASETESARLKNTMIILFFFLLGILRFSYFENNISKDELHHYYGEKMALVGTVISSELTENSQKLVLETERGRLRITKRIYPQYKYGDEIEVKGKILEPENYGTFDVKKYLAKSEIYAEMVFPEVIDLTKAQVFQDLAQSRHRGTSRAIPQQRDMRVLGKIGAEAKKILFSIKASFEEKLREILPEPAASLADGMLLGNQGVLDKGLEEDFRKSGTIHILVLSGYNITIVGVFVMAFFGFILPEAAAWVLAVVAIIGFTMMSGGEAAAVRSAIMAIIGLLALRSGRKNFAISALMWAALLMILWNPMLMRFDRGFQLSFLATLGLIVASPFFKKIFKFFPDIFGLKDSAASAFSAQIFVLPLLLSWGGEISWLSPLANILIVGVVPIIMLFSFLGGLAAFVSIGLGKVIASAAYILISYQIFFVKLFGSYEFSMMQFGFLPFFILSAIYLALFYWSFKAYAKVF